MKDIQTEAAVGYQTGYEAGLRAASVVQVGYRPFLLVPHGATLTPMEQHLMEPTRLKQAVTVLNPDSFVGYVSLFGNNDRSLVFADKDAGTFCAVLDYHQDMDSPSWNEHTCTLALKPTLAWQEWMASNKQPMNQSAFGLFLEEHMGDIAAPAGATLLEMVRNFEAKKNASFSSSIRETDGTVDFKFTETVEGASKGGQIKVPEDFTLALKPFEGSAAQAVKARLRYRIDGGKLSLSYDLFRPQEVRDAAYDAVAKDLDGRLKASARGYVTGR